MSGIIAIIAARRETMSNDSTGNSMTARAAQLGRPPSAHQARQSAGKACPDEVGSKPPSNWGAYVHEHEAAERRTFFPWRAGGRARKGETGQGRGTVAEEGKDIARCVKYRVSYRSRPNWHQQMGQRSEDERGEGDRVPSSSSWGGSRRVRARR
jgi:hypothetical protein